MFHWCTMMIVILCNLLNNMINKSIKLSTLFAMRKIKYQSTYFNPKKKTMNTMDAWNFLMKLSFCWLKHFHSSIHQNLPHVRLSLKSSDYVEQNRDPPRCYENMTTHCSPHISLANFRVSQNNTDKSYMTLSSITQTIIPLTGNKAEERKLHVYWRQNRNNLSRGKTSIVDEMWTEFSAVGNQPDYMWITQPTCIVMIWEKKMKFNQTLILYDKWEELRRWKFQTLVYSNRTTNHVTIKVKLFD